ncbi:MAG: hypothetical protein AAF411_04820 [Myxococcota bacterium]
MRFLRIFGPALVMLAACDSSMGVFRADAGAFEPACGAAGSRIEGESCECESECSDGTVCADGICARTCFDSEGCGTGECVPVLGGDLACRDVPDTCFGAGTTPAGVECACNADCAPDAGVCAAFEVEGATGRVCAAECGPEIPCGSGQRCCGSRNPVCVDDALASTLGLNCAP